MATTLEDQVDAQSAARAALTLQATGSVRALVGTFDGWYSTDDITRLTAALVVQIEAAQRQTAAVTDAYLSRVASQILGARVPPAGAIGVGDLRQGTTHAGAYGRLADQYRYRISEGDPPEVARTTVVNRGVSMAHTDVDLAFRGMVQKFMEASPATGYRRIIRPELSTEGTCGLCIVAADRTYYVEELLPLHGGCNCEVLPIIGGNDPGRNLNADDLKRIYAAAGGTNAKALRSTNVKVRDHGEIGPVLVYGRQNFRTEKQAAIDLRDTT